jgi:hypothetical protein
METTKPLMKFEGKLAKWQISGSDILTWRSMIEKKSPKLEDAINKIQNKK